jgi:RimJ/RimL family protein N-acetyltransferase
MTHQAPRNIVLETPNHIVRTMERGDATESWCKWTADPLAARTLNMAPRELTMDQLRGYIDRFDRATSHLLGIFERESGRLVGIRSIYINFAAKEFYDNILVGEADARGKRARSESTDAVLPCFFEQMDMLSSTCTILADNAHMLEIVARKGWVHEGTETKPRAIGPGTVKLMKFRLTRETWRRKMSERLARAS